MNQLGRLRAKELFGSLARLQRASERAAADMLAADRQIDRYALEQIPNLSARKRLRKV